MTADDMELVRQYVADQSESAFAALVARHTNLVYSASLRIVRDPQLAEEITQVVFVILAHKAGSLNEKTIVPGWLYRAACYTSNSALKRERRRQQREQEAYMQSTLNETGAEPAWLQIAPLLEEAMLRLSQANRDALVLRFFEKRSLNEVGTALGASEDAAKKRVNRALEKLRKFFSKRGVVSTTTIIAGVISANSVQAAPTMLAQSAAAIAVVNGAAASGPTLALIKGASEAMTWAKLKFACGIGAAALLAGGVVVVAVTNLADGEERYQIEGDLTYHTPGNDLTRHFTLTVNGPNWAVHLTSPVLEAAGIQYQEEVCLNGSVYRYFYTGKPDPASQAVNSGGAVIERGDYPVEDGTFAGPIWVGLASSGYFSGATNGRVVSLYMHPRDARTYKVNANWQLSDRPPHLPTAIDFYENRRLPPPFDLGYREAQLRVLSETNVGSMTFPLVFTCELLQPKRNGSVTSNDLDSVALYTINVRTVRLESVPQVLTPKTEGTTYVGETRFSNPSANAEQVSYLSTAERLPEQPEAEAIRQHEINMSMQARREGRLGTGQEAAAVKAAEPKTISPSPVAASLPLLPEESHPHNWIWIAAIPSLLVVTLLIRLMIRKRNS